MVAAASLLVLCLLSPSPALQDAAPPLPGSGQEAASAESRVLPLRVEDVVRLAHENAPAIRQAWLAALMGSGAVEEQEGVFDPVLFGDLTYAYTETPSTGGLFTGNLRNSHARNWNSRQGVRQFLLTGGTLELALTESYTEDNIPSFLFGSNTRANAGLTATLTQPLLRGGWELNSTFGIRRAELDYDRGVAGLRQASQDTVQAALDAYWDLAFALEDVKVKEFSLKLAQELKDITVAKYRAGAAAEVEVVQTEADIASRTDELITARNLAKAAEDRLRAMLFALEEQEDWHLELLPVSQPPEPEPTELGWAEAFETARKYRGDLRQLRIQLESRQLEWEVARRNMLPLLDLRASASSLGADTQVPDALDPILRFLSAGYSVGIVFELPIGNRAAVGAERAARLNYFLASRTLRDQEHQVMVLVRDAVRNVNYLAERVQVTAQARKVAERQLEAEQRRLQEGASTNFRVLQFQEDLVQALTNEKRARMEYAKAVARLNTVQGLNWDGSEPLLEEAEEAHPPRDLPVD